MKALKALVIGMALLIVVGIGLVGYGLMRGKQPAKPLVMVHGSDSFDVHLAVPPGAKLEQMATAGDRIVLRFSGPEGDKLLLVDPLTGELAGTIALVPAAH
jgi:hypothetical protein